MDDDGSGFIDKNELGHFLKEMGIDMEDCQMDSIMKDIDKDNSGRLEFREMITIYGQVKNAGKGKAEDIQNVNALVKSLEAGVDDNNINLYEQVQKVLTDEYDLDLQLDEIFMDPEKQTEENLKEFLMQPPKAFVTSRAAILSRRDHERAL